MALLAAFFMYLIDVASQKGLSPKGGPTLFASEHSFVHSLLVVTFCITSYEGLLAIRAFMVLGPPYCGPSCAVPNFSLE